MEIYRAGSALAPNHQTTEAGSRNVFGTAPDCCGSQSRGPDRGSASRSSRCQEQLPRRYLDLRLIWFRSRVVPSLNARLARAML